MVPRGGIELPMQTHQKQTSFADEREAAQELDRLIDDSVRLRRVSDVPLGAFLSGGIDSSTIVESLTRQQGQDRVETFSIGFEERTFSELGQASAVAELLGVSHRGRTVSAPGPATLARILGCAGEPFADTSIIPLYFLAALAREQVTR